MEVLKEHSIEGQDLTNKHVVLMEKYFRGATDIRRVFRCEGGFGCSPNTIGRAVFGALIYSGNKFRVNREEVGRFATEEEVKEAQEIREKEKKLLIKFKHSPYEAFRLFTGEEWKNYVESQSKVSRDGLEFATAKDYFDCTELAEISELEFNILNRLFPNGLDSFGCFSQ